MTFQMKDKWNIPVTAVADEFIDCFMAAANGEYVKVYLYILRHHGEMLTQEMIADALNHTESDVRRALAYWEKAGVLCAQESPAGQPQEHPQGEEAGQWQGQPQGEEAAQRQEHPQGEEAGQWQGQPQGQPAAQPRGENAARPPAAVRRQQQSAASAAEAQETAGLAGAVPSGGQPCEPAQPGRAAAQSPESCAREKTEAASRETGPVYSAEQVNRLSGDEEFAQLLYIAQKYMNKVFTPRDCQVFAYLYDGLKFSPELLEYLVEYCVQNGHVSIRYMETVALNWHKRGFRTPEEAKEYTEAFNSDAFSVMKAFGLGDRRPGTAEQQTIRRWFKDYGFDREIVLMACNRTIASIHNPSFQYADKILSDWKQAGVRTKADVEALDEKRTKSRGQDGVAGGQPKYGQSQDGGRRKPGNQFHNFKQRDTDYDALVLKQLKERVGQQP